jgi:hypothetical protein
MSLVEPKPWLWQTAKVCFICKVFCFARFSESFFSRRDFSYYRPIFTLQKSGKMVLMSMIAAKEGTKLFYKDWGKRMPKKRMKTTVVKRKYVRGT